MRAVMQAFAATLRAVVSDRYAIVAMIGAVLLYSFFYPQAYRLQVASNQPIAVVDLDGSSASRDLVRRLDAVRAIAVVARPADIGQARRALERGQVDGFVLIPACSGVRYIRGDAAISSRKNPEEGGRKRAAVQHHCRTCNQGASWKRASWL